MSRRDCRPSGFYTVKRNDENVASLGILGGLSKNREIQATVLKQKAGSGGLDICTPVPKEYRSK